MTEMINVDVCLESSRRNLSELSLVLYKDSHWFSSLRRKILVDVGGTFWNFRLCSTKAHNGFLLQEERALLMWVEPSRTFSYVLQRPTMVFFSKKNESY